jgi:cell division protein FtsN
MARDYKNAGSRKRGKGSGPAFSGWVGLGLGLTLGLALAAGVHLHHTTNPGVTLPEPAADGADGQAGDTPDRTRPRFDFYRLLPNYEVVIPEQDIEVAPSAQEEITDAGTYVLQAGSFRNAADADRLRARIALLGVESRIQTVTIDDEDTWHRVRVGPIRDIEQLNIIRERLAGDTIETLVIRVGD